jgi:hypothetical protein
MFSTLLIMDIYIESNENNVIDYITLEKMKFLYNALESGWTIVKKDDKYIFNKKHEGEKEIYLESYLQQFILANMNGVK